MGMMSGWAGEGNEYEEREKDGIEYALLAPPPTNHSRYSQLNVSQRHPLRRAWTTCTAELSTLVGADPRNRSRKSDSQVE